MPKPVPVSLEAFSGEGPFSVLCNVSDLANEDQIQWRKIVNDTDLDAYRQMSSEACITPAEPTTTDTPSSTDNALTDLLPLFLLHADVIAEGSTLVFGNITFEDEGYYVCLVSISTGVCYSESLNLTGKLE